MPKDSNTETPFMAPEPIVKASEQTSCDRYIFSVFPFWATHQTRSGHSPGICSVSAGY